MREDVSQSICWWRLGITFLPVQQALVCRIYLGLFTCPFSNYISPSQQGFNQRWQGRWDLQSMFGTPSCLPFSVVYASEKFIVKCFTIWRLWDFAIVSPEQIKVQYKEGLQVCLSNEKIGWEGERQRERERADSIIFCNENLRITTWLISLCPLLSKYEVCRHSVEASIC